MASVNDEPVRRQVSATDAPICPICETGRLVRCSYRESKHLPLTLRRPHKCDGCRRLLETPVHRLSASIVLLGCIAAGLAIVVFRLTPIVENFSRMSWLSGIIDLIFGVSVVTLLAHIGRLAFQAMRKEWRCWDDA